MHHPRTRNLTRTVTALAAAAALSLPLAWHPAPAAAGTDPMPGMTQEAPVFGAEIMTPKELDAYRKQLAAAKSDDERAKIEAKHHDDMVALAKKKGVTLKETAPMAPEKKAEDWGTEGSY